jgi:hypothetical protein
MHFFLAKSLLLLWLDERMNIFTREVGRRWEANATGLLPGFCGILPGHCPLLARLCWDQSMPVPSSTWGPFVTLGTRRIGDVGALFWIAEQLDFIRLINRAWVCLPESHLKACPVTQFLRSYPIGGIRGWRQRKS